MSIYDEYILSKSNWFYWVVVLTICFMFNHRNVKNGTIIPNDECLFLFFLRRIETINAYTCCKLLFSFATVVKFAHRKYQIVDILLWNMVLPGLIAGGYTLLSICMAATTPNSLGLALFTTPNRHVHCVTAMNAPSFSRNIKEPNSWTMPTSLCRCRQGR